MESVNSFCSTKMVLVVCAIFLNIILPLPELSCATKVKTNPVQERSIPLNIGQHSTFESLENVSPILFICPIPTHADCNWASLFRASQRDVFEGPNVRLQDKFNPTSDVDIHNLNLRPVRLNPFECSPCRCIFVFVPMDRRGGGLFMAPSSSVKKRR